MMIVVDKYCYIFQYSEDIVENVMSFPHELLVFTRCYVLASCEHTEVMICLSLTLAHLLYLRKYNVYLNLYVYPENDLVDMQRC